MLITVFKRQVPIYVCSSSTSRVHSYLFDWLCIYWCTAIATLHWRHTCVVPTGNSGLSGPVGHDDTSMEMDDRPQKV